MEMNSTEEFGPKDHNQFIKIADHEVSLFSTQPIQSIYKFDDSYDRSRLLKLNDAVGVLMGTNHSSGSPITIFVHKSRVIRIGRRKESSDFELQQVILSNPCVSSIHCYIWCIQFDDSVKPITYLQNLSSNGTIINGDKVLQQGELVIIEHGYSIEIVNGINVVFEYNSSKNIHHSNSCVQRGTWRIDDHVIGIGTFGKVYICKMERTTKLFAVKVVNIQKSNIQKEDYSKESSLLLKLNHPNIIRIFETNVSLDKRTVEIFQELAIGGDLFSYLAKDESFLKAIDEVESLIITFQMVRALSYLNDQNVIHRDLKLDNILIMGVPKKYPRIVIADFGIAKQKVNTRGKTRLYTVVGTPEYCAPEVGQFRRNQRGKENQTHSSNEVGSIRGEKEGYGSKCDVWSLGVITHIMLSGISPFYSTSVDKIGEKVQRGVLYLETSNWMNISTEAKDFVRKCIDVDYETRYDIRDCLMRSAWFNKGKRRKEWLVKIYDNIVAGE